MSSPPKAEDGDDDDDELEEVEFVSVSHVGLLRVMQFQMMTKLIIGMCHISVFFFHRLNVF